MPIYEEKLISPLAVRFTQEHIKTVFRDQHVVEDTAAQIEALPCGEAGDYDLVLKAPFPAIEIVRWSAPGMKDGDRHWFTLDNRRLYCLQRAAAKHWPKRVAACVEILYADPGSVRRKYDSVTFGRTVTVAHSCKEAALFRWDWQSEVTNARFVAPFSPRPDDSKAWVALEVDDKKDTAEALCDVEGADEADSMDRAIEALLAQEASAQHGKPLSAVRTSSSAPSTAAPSDDESSDDHRSSASDGSPHGAAKSALPRAAAAPKTRKAGAAATALAEQAVAEIIAQLQAHGDGRVRVPRWAERYGAALGGMRHFLESHPEAFTVEPGKAGQWTVTPVGDRAAINTVAAAAPSSRGSSRRGQGAAGRGDVAERGAAEIQAQLDAAGTPGYVHIPDWNRRYLAHLGQLRQFAETRPDLFAVVPCGKGFRIGHAGRC